MAVDYAVLAFATAAQRARALLALLQPLTGTRATGTVVLTAPTGQQVAVGRNRYLYPVVGGAVRPDLAFKTAQGPAESGGWIVDDAGTEVDVVSNIGGKRHNLPEGTKFVLDPPSAALVGDVVLQADVTDGADRTSYGAVRDAVVFESMDGPAVSLDMRRSALKAFPAVVVAWQSAWPQDGPTSQHAAARSRYGDGKYSYAFRYTATIVSSRVDGDVARRGEGLAIMNAVMLTLGGRQAVDGEAVSSPSGVRVMSAQREDGPQEEYKKYYVYNVLLSVEVALQTIDERTWADWLLTDISADKP